MTRIQAGQIWRRKSDGAEVEVMVVIRDAMGGPSDIHWKPTAGGRKHLRMCYWEQFNGQYDYICDLEPEA